MARQNINANSSEKLFEAFMDFSGGLNTEMSNEQLRDNEFTQFQNINLDGINPRLRTGRINLGTAGTAGNAQGMFFYYQINAIAPHIIVAANGRLYRIVANSSIEIPMKDGDDPFTFQTTRIVEAVQYRETLYIATGTKLVEVWIEAGEGGTDVWKARTVTPYTPTVMEAIYIGTNALADNPSGYIQDGTATKLAATGIQPDRQKSAINIPVEFTAFIDKRVSYTGTHDFKWEYKKSAEKDTDFKVQQDWTAGAQTEEIKFTEVGPYDVKVSVRETDTPVTGFSVVGYNDVDPTNHPISHMTDGLDSTYWEGSYGPFTGYSTTFYADLGSVKQVSSIILKHYGAYLKTTSDPYSPSQNTSNFDVRISNDNSSYQVVATVTNNVDDITTTSINASCRYIMIVVGKPSLDGTGNTKIVDMKLLGPPSADSKPSSFTLSNYAVNTTDTLVDTPTEGIRQCNKIVLHWDRLILYGDPTHPYQVYISDLTNPYYFPTTNTIPFNTGKLEAITSITRFQDLLVIFTKTTIQTLTGKSPEDYARYQIHDGLGAMAGGSVRVVGNNVMFLSHEGVMMLKPNPYRLETMNVARADGQIKSEMPIDADACSIVTQGQYWLCFPQKRIIYRLYYERGVWVKDVNPESLNFRQFLLYGEDIYNLTTDAKLLRHDENTYTDNGTLYSMVVESKHLDFSSSFNNKKIKKLYVLARHYTDHSVDLFVTVLADSAIVMTPDKGWAEVNPTTGYVEWKTSTEPNMHLYTGTTLGQWIMGQSPFGESLISVQKAAVRGKCRRTKIRFEYKGGQPCEFYGFGFEFRLKKP